MSSKDLGRCWWLRTELAGETAFRSNLKKGEKAPRKIDKLKNEQCGQHALSSTPFLFFLEGLCLRSSFRKVLRKSLKFSQSRFEKFFPKVCGKAPNLIRKQHNMFCLDLRLICKLGLN